MIVHESSTKTVWIDDSVAVRLTDNNNVLLVDVDARGAFATVGEARITLTYPSRRRLAMTALRCSAIRRRATRCGLVSKGRLRSVRLCLRERPT